MKRETRLPSPAGTAPFEAAAAVAAPPDSWQARLAGHYRRAEASGEAFPAALHADPVTIESDSPPEEAARDAVGRAFEQVAGNIAVVCRTKDAEGPHQLRNGLRRLAISFNAYKRVLGRSRVEPLVVELGWLNREIGRLRDIEVARGILRHATEPPDAPDLARLDDSLSNREAAARRDARAVLLGTRTRHFLAGVAELLDRQTRGKTATSGKRHPPTRLIEIADSALKRRWRSVRKRAKGLRRPDDDECHRFRKSLRKAVHTAELFRSLYWTAGVGPFLGRAKECQEALGGLNDLCVARALIGDSALSDVHDAATRQAIERLMNRADRHRRHAWKTARARWDELQKTEPFWHTDR